MTDVLQASDSRARVLRAIQEAGEPVTVDQLAQRTGLHANTVRGHVDVLLAIGEVVREPATATGRGRPRWLYQAARPQASPYRALAEALVGQLAQAGDATAVRQAAERWSQALPEPGRAGTPDEGVALAARALNQLGFVAEPTAIGDAITISRCPYADLTADSLAICEVHAALLAQLLEQTQQGVTMHSLDILPKPGVCVARLHRPDLTPVKSITPH